VNGIPDLTTVKVAVYRFLVCCGRGPHIFFLIAVRSPKGQVSISRSSPATSALVYICVRRVVFSGKTYLSDFWRDFNGVGGHSWELGPVPHSEKNEESIMDTSKGEMLQWTLHEQEPLHRGFVRWRRNGRLLQNSEHTSTPTNPDMSAVRQFRLEHKQGAP